MSEAHSSQPELPNLVTIVADKFHGVAFFRGLYAWENFIFSFMLVCSISLIAFFCTRKAKIVPGRFQSAIELFVSGVDGFLCAILGPKGRKYVPFIGTLFIYILSMNFLGMVPFMKSPTASWSTTLALALCVFFYLQYTAFKELGLGGYFYHMAGRPKGFLAFSVIIPLLILFIEAIGELVRPLSLSLRLRSNIWGDDMLLTIMAGFGLKGVPMLVFNSFLAIMAGLVQAVVFCLLTTIYFALILEGEHEHGKNL